MKFDTNKERQESTARVIEGARNDIAEIKAELRSIYTTRKGLEIKYLDIFYNVMDEEFEILGIFTIYGRVFWVSRSNTIILKTIFVNEFAGEIEEWIQCYVTKEKRLKNIKNKYPENRYPDPVAEEPEREEVARMERGLAQAEFHQDEVREGHIAGGMLLQNQYPIPTLRVNVAQPEAQEAANPQPMLRPNRVWRNDELLNVHPELNAQARHALNRIHNDLVAAPDVDDHPMPPFR